MWVCPLSRHNLQQTQVCMSTVCIWGTYTMGNPIFCTVCFRARPVKDIREVCTNVALPTTCYFPLDIWNLNLVWVTSWEVSNTLIQYLVPLNPVPWTLNPEPWTLNLKPILCFLSRLGCCYRQTEEPDQWRDRGNRDRGNRDLSYTSRCKWDYKGNVVSEP